MTRIMSAPEILVNVCLLFLCYFYVIAIIALTGKMKEGMDLNSAHTTTCLKFYQLVVGLVYSDCKSFVV